MIDSMEDKLSSDSEELASKKEFHNNNGSSKIPTASRLLSAFQDIMMNRDESDLSWVSRDFSPMDVNKNSNKRTPAQIRKDVMISSRIQYVIDELSQEKNIPAEQLWLELNDILIEMGQTQTLPIVRWFGYALCKIMKRIYKGVYVNEESINRLKASIGDGPVIFMPSHRSYADFLLMSYICFHYNIKLPIIAAGMDFVAMWGIGRLLRDSGAFFIRRSFGSDKLYWAAFSEYVQTLITAGDSPLEFFVEGTRSRTAKSLSPKLGLLSVALEPYFTGQVSDILIVPINISYDRTLEEILYSYELLGVPKPKESTSGLFKALQVLDDQYGSIHIDFTNPISIRQYCGDLRNINYLKPLHLPYEPKPEEGVRVTKLAHQVIRQQQQNSVLSVFSLISLALTSLEKPKFNELIREVAWLRSVVETLGALVNVRTDIEHAVKESLETHKSLVHVTRHNNIVLKSIHSTNKNAEPITMKGHNLSPATLESAVPVVMLQHYINQTLYLFICPAIVTLVLKHSAIQGSADKSEVFKKYKFLRTLFSHEFALHKSWEEMDFEETLKQLDLLHIMEERCDYPSKLIMGNHKKLQNLLIQLLNPFVYGYITSCQTLTKMSINAPVNLSQILQAVQHNVEIKLSSGELTNYYSLSLDLLSNSITAFTYMGALNRIKENGKIFYQGNEEKLRNIADTLSDLQKFNTESNNIDIAEQLLVQERAKL